MVAPETSVCHNLLVGLGPVLGMGPQLVTLCGRMLLHSQAADSFLLSCLLGSLLLVEVHIRRDHPVAGHILHVLVLHSRRVRWVLVAAHIHYILPFVVHTLRVRDILLAAAYLPVLSSLQNSSIQMMVLSSCRNLLVPPLLG